MASSYETPSSVFLGLGSNLGDREANLREARAGIESLGLEILKASSIYETEPVGYVDQPWFLNQVIEVSVAPIDREAFLNLVRPDPSAEVYLAAATPDDSSTWPMVWIDCLFRATQAIERRIGRDRLLQNGPRVIDIDILLFGDYTFFSAITQGSWLARATANPEGLAIPHPRMHERRFVLEPLCEIAPNLMHPSLNRTVRQLVSELRDPSTVHRYVPK